MGDVTALLCPKGNCRGYYLDCCVDKNSKRNKQKQNKNSVPNNVCTDLNQAVCNENNSHYQFAKGINLDMVQEIAALMHQKMQIHFFAKGLTSIVFDYASRHLLSLSRHVTLYQDTHIAYIQAEQLTENDIRALFDDIV